MSIRRIPDRYLKDTLFIYRESATIDSVGDFDTALSLAYAELKANVQPQISDVDYSIQGIVHKQTHAACCNITEDGVVREIQPGDTVLVKETGARFLVLGIKLLEASNRYITDSHHFTLILETATGEFDGVVKFRTVAAKAKIA